MPKDDPIGLDIEKTVSVMQNILKRNRSKQIEQQIDLVSKIIVLSLKSNNLGTVQNILNLNSEDKWAQYDNINVLLTKKAASNI
jgi:hypothetical protein